MKKKILLVSFITMLGAGSFLASCSKDDDEDKSCKCTVTYTSGGGYDYWGDYVEGETDTETLRYTSDKLKREGLKDCYDAEDFAKSEWKKENQGKTFKKIACAEV